MLEIKKAEQKHVIGTNQTNTMAQKNGEDEIDLWAMSIGQAERTKHEITPTKKHNNRIY